MSRPELFERTKRDDYGREIRDYEDVDEVGEVIDNII